MQRDELVNSAREASATSKEKAAARIRSTTPEQAMTLLAVAIAVLMVVSCIAMGMGLAQQQLTDRPAIVSSNHQIVALRAEIDRLKSEIEFYSHTETFLVGELKAVRGREAALRAENERLVTASIPTGSVIDPKINELVSTPTVKLIGSTDQATAELLGLPLLDLTGEPHCIVTDNGPARVAVFNRLPSIEGVHMIADFALLQDDGSEMEGKVFLRDDLIEFSAVTNGNSLYFAKASDGSCGVYTTRGDTPQERVDNIVVQWQGKWK